VFTSGSSANWIGARQGGPDGPHTVLASGEGGPPSAGRSKAGAGERRFHGKCS
jgi:hypothetical protein